MIPIGILVAALVFGIVYLVCRPSKYPSPTERTRLPINFDSEEEAEDFLNEALKTIFSSKHAASDKPKQEK